MKVRFVLKTGEVKYLTGKEIVIRPDMVIIVDGREYELEIGDYFPNISRG